MEWYLGAFDENCDDTCAAAGMVCTNQYGRERQPDTDTQAEFVALLNTIRDNHRYTGTIPPDTFDYSPGGAAFTPRSTGDQSGMWTAT